MNPSALVGDRNCSPATPPLPPTAEQRLRSKLGLIADCLYRALDGIPSEGTKAHWGYVRMQVDLVACLTVEAQNIILEKIPQAPDDDDDADLPDTVTVPVADPNLPTAQAEGKDGAS